MGVNKQLKVKFKGFPEYFLYVKIIFATVLEHYFIYSRILSLNCVCWVSHALFYINRTTKHLNKTLKTSFGVTSDFISVYFIPPPKGPHDIFHSPPPHRAGF